MTNKPTELVVTQALLPCPFCGKRAIIETFPSGLKQVSCSDDDASSCLAAITWGSFATEAEAIAAWNTRYRNSDIASTAPASEDEVELDRLAEILANFARDRFANTKELTWATMGEHGQQYFRDAVNVVRAARARKAHQDAIEEAAKVAESFPFSDSAAIAHRIRALIDKEPGE